MFTWKAVKVFPDAAWASDQPLIVSDRLREFLEREGDDLAKFYPIRLRGPRSQFLRQRYWYVHWRRVWACVPDPTIPEIDPDRMPVTSRIGVVKTDHWWADGRVLLRDELKREIEHARLIGIRFQRAKVRSCPRDIIRRKNSVTQKWELVERRLVPDDRHFDAKAYFESGGRANGPGRIRNSTPFHDYVAAHSFIGTLRLSYVKRFLEEGGDPNVGRGPNVSPLVISLAPLTVRAVRLLHAYNANFNMQNPIGYTALMSAATGGELDVVRALIEAGAKPSLRDCHKRTAKDCVEEAVERGQLSPSRARRVIALLTLGKAKSSRKHRMRK
jgi:hypothetical protein